jgi:hypothetical protein
MSDQPIPRHGLTQYYIVGEGLTPAAMPSPRLRALVPRAAAALEAAAREATPEPVDENRAFRFCRLFPDLEKSRPDDAGLIALGQSLADPFVPGAGNSLIPAGFTYLGQFVDHDITFDRTAGLPDGSLDPEEIEQGRTPALELDSVYGRGPADSPELYEADRVRLKIRTTTGRPICCGSTSSRRPS